MKELKHASLTGNLQVDAYITAGKKPDDTIDTGLTLLEYASQVCEIQEFQKFVDIFDLKKNFHELSNENKRLIKNLTFFEEYNTYFQDWDEPKNYRD